MAFQLVKTSSNQSMPKLKPVSLRELIRRLRALVFDGPYHGGKHPVIFRGYERYKEAV